MGALLMGAYAWEHKCRAQSGRQSGCHLLRAVARYSRELLFGAYNSCAVGTMGAGPPSRFRSYMLRGSVPCFIRRPSWRQESGEEINPPVAFYPPVCVLSAGRVLSTFIAQTFVCRSTVVVIRRPTIIRLAFSWPPVAIRVHRVPNLNWL